MPTITALKASPHTSATQQQKAESNQHVRYIAIINTLETPQHAKRIKAPRLTVFENQGGLLQSLLR